LVDALLSGAIAGYGIAIPVGAIAVLIIEAGLRRGFRIAAAAGAGAATADGLYAAAAAVSGAALATLLAPYRTPLQLLAVVVLVFLGGRGLLALRTRGDAQTAGAARPAQGRQVVGTFLVFLGLTLLNPQTIAYFAALILGLPSLAAGLPERIAFVSGAFLASLSWQTLLAAFGAFLHGRADERLRRLTSLIGSLVILGFAVAIALDVLRR
jgi:threonine/homoserine/homoserine lactone efflux protein